MALGTLLAVAVALALTLLLTDAPGAQPRTARVGLLVSSSEANFGPNVTVIREALRRAGWVEGRNLTLDVRYLGEHYARLPELAAELVGRRPDVLVSRGTPATLAAKTATTTIPIVMESLSDVVSTGLVSSLARAGGNVTGVSGFTPELMGKRLELIREMVPRADEIAELVNRSNPVTASILRATEAAGRQIGMKLRVIDVRRPTELEAAFETMRRGHADALVLVADPMLFTERPSIIQLAPATECRPSTSTDSLPRSAASSPTVRALRSGSSGSPSTWTASCGGLGRASCPSSSRPRSSW
jgi:putative tryptophan/tyrosine transport system substrate-binding protein